MSKAGMISSLGRNHSRAGAAEDEDRTLCEEEVDPNPILEFQRWLDLAWQAGEPQPDAMTLATASMDAIPSARMVLLRQVDERGFVFFTNYESLKGTELAANPRAALVFHWPLLQRQVRVSGQVRQTTRAESRRYWAERPAGSRVAAAASAQSRVLPRREVLEETVVALHARYADGPPLPGFWGGYRVRPDVIEFWQGRRHRLHDRLRYRRQRQAWGIERLAP